MSKEEFSRTANLIGEDSLIILKNSSVAVFGAGGVGGFVCEALARCGVGSLTIVDHDTVSLSNINRQIIALHSTVGQKKVDVIEKRVLDINPECRVEKRDCFYLSENADTFDFTKYDYVVDAVDTVQAKIEIIQRCKNSGVRIISSMGTGNKLDPLKFQIDDISKTNVCPLARVMRRELKARNIEKVDVLFSTEKPVEPLIKEKQDNGKIPPASIAFVPSVAGLLIAGHVVKKLCGII